MRHGWRWLAVGIGVAALVWGGERVVAAWKAHAARARWRVARTELERARQEMARGRFDDASARLARVEATGPVRGEVALLRGICEQEAGRPEGARAAWAIVPEDSPFFPSAALRLAPLEQARGRFAEAERLAREALRRSGSEAVEARKILAEVLYAQGRFDEVRSLVEENWRALTRSGPGHADEADALLNFHLALGLNPLPAERLRAMLDQAATRSPDDDRVWLGRANLAIRAGDVPEARRRLDACRGRRPDDPAVWRAVLEGALASGDVAEARAAVAHLGAEDLPPGRVASLRAWFAARRGDDAAERRALEDAVAADPGDLVALERLAELVEPERGDELRRRKAEQSEALYQYRVLFRSGGMIGAAPKMARMARALGRTFEARALLTLALRLDPDHDQARANLERLIREDEAPREKTARTLAALLGPLDAPAGRSDRPAPCAIRFGDDAGPSGLAFTYETGASDIHQMPEAMGGGIGLLDYDGDGFLDVYCVQGGSFPPSASRSNADRLLRNKGDGTYEDATERSGIAAMAGGYGHGVAVGDVDNDGHPDLFLTRWRSYALYRNRGDGTFEDATAAWGLGGGRDWPTSAAFADLDGDGDLDLYVCHYLDWDPDRPALCQSQVTRKAITCDPLGFSALPDHLFRNDGDRFTDVTEEAGLVDQDGRGLGVVAADLDDDGRVDLFVANDTSANFCFRNLGGMRFEEVAHQVGLAGNADGGYQSGMGIACGDLDGDGRIDLAVTNFYGESTTFFQNLGDGLFADRTAAVGLAAPSRYLLGFGAAFLDADADGHLDLLTVNGHVADERPEIPFAMPAQLLRGGPDGRLADVTKQSGPPFQVAHVARALAVGDLDDDGRVDAVVLSHGEPITYLRNRTEGGHGLTLRLEGTASNRDAVGARVTVEADGRRWVAQRFGGGSYQSAGDGRLRFGLGGASRADRVEVRWPSGRVDRYDGLAAEAAYLLREGDGEARPLAGRGR